MTDRLSDGRFVDGRYGSGEEALDFRKKSRILKTVFVYLEKCAAEELQSFQSGQKCLYGWEKKSWRVDLVCLKILRSAGRGSPDYSGRGFSGIDFSSRGKNRVILNHYLNVFDA